MASTPSSISQGRASKKITRPVIVGLQVLIVNLHVVQDETCKKTLTEEQEIISRKSSNWFQEDQFLKILKDLKPALTSRVNCSQPGTSKINYQSKDLKSIKDLKVSYNFKKRPNIPGQHFVLQKSKNVYCLCGKKVMKKYVDYSSYPIFHETLEIKVKKCNTFETECLHSHTIQKPVDEMKGDRVTDTATSSYYFGKETERVHTSSVKRKKTTLRKIAKKSRTALVELPSYQKTSEAESENEEEIEETYSGRSPTIPTGRRTKKRRQTAVIDLEKEPEGLKDVSKVEDLRRDHLKFLINQMEDYLRTIFRGEVYCRRHEDYKKGGKLRDDLNFQVGMAHFSEEQHECILNSLGAMFCYRNKKYLDYVMKVMLPEALIKLYQDIHKTSFEKAEECLFNDTIRDD